MSLTSLLLFVLGLVLLAGSSELVVSGGVRLARTLHVSPLLIGMVVVGFGTSSPELVVSVVAAFRGDTEIAVGNVVGSNIFNILAILGPVSLIAPLTVSRVVAYREAPLVVGVSVVMLLVSLGGLISRLEGAILFAGIVAYIVLSYRVSRAETRAQAQELPPADQGFARMLFDLAIVAVGIALLVVGARLVVEGSIAIARTFGISERVIALTLVSGGTSLPELATSLMAGVRGQREIALGNILGSNVFNTLCILGAAALARPLPISPAVLTFDLPVMLAAVAAAWVMTLTGHRITRGEGALLSAGYVAYVAVLLLRPVVS